MIFADDPRCERWTAIADGCFRCSQLIVVWHGDELIARCARDGEDPNAVALSHPINSGDRFLIATIIDGVRERRSSALEGAGDED